MAEKEEGEEEKQTWSAATNWIVAHGSLRNTISFESPTDEEEEEEKEESSSRSKPALVLKPPPSNSSPCEINVCFHQKHEVLQVYVRSTSRVYEIYYAPEQQSNSDYLCTVRCGVAAREDGILQTGDIGEATAEDHDLSSRKTPEIPNQTAKSDGTNSNNSDEDGWVEVKVPDSPLLTDTTKPMAKEINQKTGIDIQDYYEATAEITDSYPCISLTLRLLSLQVKGCVAIEEIYIFAEPVESTNVGHSLASVESSAGSNLLAMLVPSLLQLSKPGSSRVQDRNISDIREERRLQGSESKATESISPELQREVNQETPINMADPKEVRIQEPAEDRTQHRQLESVPHSSHSSNIPMYEEDKKMSVGHLEKMLGQLDSRLARIEVFCARFEENMLKPLNCMATRMQRLEHQLDELSLRSRSPTPRAPPCSRIIAPEFPYDESGSNSHHAHSNDDNVDSVSEAAQDAPFGKPSSSNIDSFRSRSPTPRAPPCSRIVAPEFPYDESESDSLPAHNDENVDSVSEAEQDAPFDKPSSSNIDASASATSPPELVPHWVVKAPEFSYSDDDSDNNCYDTSEFARKDVPLDKPSLSIDRALASALGSLILSTSFQPSTLSPALMAKAPDANENDKEASPSASVSREGAKSHKTDFHGNHSTEKIKDLDSSPCTTYSSKDSKFQLTKESPVKVTDQSCTDTAAGDLNEMGQTDDACTEESTDGVVSSNQPSRELFENNTTVSSSSETVGQNQTIVECASRSTTDNVEVMSPNQFCADVATVKGDIAKSYLGSSDGSGGKPTTEGDAPSTEMKDAGRGMDRLENELKQPSRPVLDFELPILDVKFISQENLHLRLPLETLLGNVLETITHPSGLKYDHNDKVANKKEDNMNFGDSEEKEGPMVNDPFSELEDLTAECLSPCLQVEELQDMPSSCGSIEEPFSSLI